jgi:hypothetical protein
MEKQASPSGTIFVSEIGSSPAHPKRTSIVSMQWSPRSERALRPPRRAATSLSQPGRWDELAPPSGELLDIQQIVTDVAERLAVDPDILERHARDIQQLDVEASMLASLARRAPGRDID